VELGWVQFPWGYAFGRPASSRARSSTLGEGPNIVGGEEASSGPMGYAGRALLSFRWLGNVGWCGPTGIASGGPRRGRLAVFRGAGQWPGLAQGGGGGRMPDDRWHRWPRVLGPMATTSIGSGARQCDARGKVLPDSVCPAGGGGGQRSFAAAAAAACRCP
jgi:hypothetical protein